LYCNDILTDMGNWQDLRKDIDREAVMIINYKHFRF
jgi:hypothetical protein